MGFNRATQGVILFLVIASLLAMCQARTIVVGGSKGWRTGVNYTEWTIQNQPFHYGDILVFKYNVPSKHNAGHSVYLLPNVLDYVRCDFRAAKLLLAGPKQGSGKGFSVVLNQRKPYYFASGEGNGHDCSVGEMKFIVVPWPRLEY